MTRVSVADCPHSPAHPWSARSRCHAMRADAIREREQSGKRVRHVVDSAEVAHLWTHKAQSDARNSKGSLYFRGETIFSYGEHFPIARHVENKGGKSAVLFTTQHYSVTTSSHCSTVWNACHHLTLFRVPDMMADSKTAHAANLADYAARIGESLLKSARARSTWAKSANHRDASELRREAIAYAEFYKLAYARVLPSVPALDSEELAQLKAREAKAQAAKAQKTLRENAEAIARWRNGESVRLPYGLPDMLRVSKDGTEIETSRGASFPISHAKRGLALVRAVRERGEAWHTNSHTCRLGHYQINSIATDGTVKAGCHTVRYSEIVRVASAIDAAPSVLESLEQTDNAEVSSAND
jgi:hypothetical protein